MKHCPLRIGSPSFLRPGAAEGLHGVVHSAGGSNTIGPVTHLDSELWRGVVDLNVNGTMYVLKHSAREMVRGGGGAFVGISSIAASNTLRWFGRTVRPKPRWTPW